MSRKNIIWDEEEVDFLTKINRMQYIFCRE